jgi:hypothetical protein
MSPVSTFFLLLYVSFSFFALLQIYLLTSTHFVVSSLISIYLFTYSFIHSRFIYLLISSCFLLPSVHSFSFYLCVFVCSFVLSFHFVYFILCLCVSFLLYLFLRLPFCLFTYVFLSFFLSFLLTFSFLPSKTVHVGVMFCKYQLFVRDYHQGMDTHTHVSNIRQKNCQGRRLESLLRHSVRKWIALVTSCNFHYE